MGFHQIKELLHSKDNNYQNDQNEDKTYEMEENICKLHIWQEINIENI